MKVLEICNSKDAVLEGQALAKHIMDRYTVIAKPLAELHLEHSNRNTTHDIDKVSASTTGTDEPFDQT